MSLRLSLKKFTAALVAFAVMITLLAPATTFRAFADEAYLFPVSGGYRITGTYSSSHDGLDIAAALDTPIHATKSGTVVAVIDGDVPNKWIGYGRGVVIQHEDGMYSHYAHMNYTSVSEGQYVSQGTVIGGMGTTGNSTGVHLHFAVATSIYGAGGRINVNTDAIPYIYGTGSQLVTPDITTDKETYKVGDTVNISWTASPADSNLSHYWLNIDGPSGGFGPGRMDKNTSYSFTASEVGNIIMVVYATPYGSESGEGSLTATKTITVIPAHEHSYTSKITKEATCTEDGEMTFTCECGDTYKEAIKATGHSWSEWTVETPATTTSFGVETRTCSKCGETEARTIPKLDPSYDDFLLGDVNNDGKVNSADITKIAAHIKGLKTLDEDQKKRADVNQDGKINSADITKIAAHIKGLKKLQ